MKVREIVLARAALCACGQSAGYAPVGDNGRPDAGVNTTDCETWCELRAPGEENDAWCPIDCLQTCRQLSANPPEAVETCITGDPLCFISAEQCVESVVQRAKCASWCDERATQHQNDGFCEPFLQGNPDEDCETACFRALREALPEEGVARCVQSDPLCFLDLRECAYSSSSTASSM
jgi:hypothetical protein